MVTYLVEKEENSADILYNNIQAILLYAKKTASLFPPNQASDEEIKAIHKELFIRAALILREHGFPVPDDYFTKIRQINRLGHNHDDVIIFNSGVIFEKIGSSIKHRGKE